MKSIKLLLCLISIFTLALFSSPSNAGEIEVSTKSKESRFLEAFYGYCYRNMEDFNRIKAAAKTLKWQKLEGDMKALVAPEDKNAELDSWYYKDDDLMVFIGLSNGKIESRDATACTMVTSKVDADLLHSNLKRKFKLVLINKEVDPYQIYYTYKFSDNGLDGEHKKHLISVTLGSDKPRDIITISILNLDESSL